MINLLPIGLAVALLAVVAVMVFGLFTMAKGGEFAKKHANRLMRARIATQLFALFMFVLTLAFWRQ